MKIDKSKIEKILIINFGTADEVLHSTPVAENLHYHFPETLIFYLVQMKCSEVLRNNPFITRTLTYNFETDNLKCLKENIRKQKYDLILDLSGDSISSAVTSSSRVKYKVGSAKELTGMNNSSAANNNIESYLNCIKTMGLEIVSKVPKVYKISLPDL